MDWNYLENVAGLQRCCRVRYATEGNVDVLIRRKNVWTGTDDPVAVKVALLCLQLPGTCSTVP